MIRGVILDLFGTLLRLASDRKPYLRLVRLLNPEDPARLPRFSLVVDAPDLPSFITRTGGATPTSLPDLERDLRADLESAVLFEDTLETLVTLRASGRKLGLISNLAAPYKAPFLDLGLAPYFDSARFSCDFGACKPSPEIFLAMARDLGIPPRELVMVGDRVRSDVAGAEGVGMAAILLERIAALRSSESISTLRDLPGRLLRIRPAAKP